MYDNGINNEFEGAHQRGLTRGFDLGWSYKGRFDRQIVQDHINKLEEKLSKANTGRQKLNYKQRIFALNQVLRELKEHPNNRENITFGSW